MNGGKRNSPGKEGPGAVNVKLIALDMDGTLLGEDHYTIPERNLAALRSASRLGVKIAIASGRCWSLVRECSEEIGVVDYAVLANGASVLDARRGTELVSTGIGKAQRNAIIGVLRERGISFEVYRNGQSYMEGFQAVWEELEGELLPPLAKVVLEAVTPVEDLTQALGEGTVEKFNVFRVRPEEREELLRAIGATGAISCTNGAQDNLEIAAAGVDKGVALERLAALLGLTEEEVMAFGDAGNDLGMLSWAHWSFAMGNAAPEVKKTARFVTASNGDAGVAQAVERYVLGLG